MTLSPNFSLQALFLLSTLILNGVKSLIFTFVLLLKLLVHQTSSIFVRRTQKLEFSDFSTPPPCKECSLKGLSRTSQTLKGCWLYRGVVRHTRTNPKFHSFKYSVRYALVDLDETPEFFKNSTAHHLSADEARKFAGTSGKVYLLTNPVSLGFEQNPISVYFCYDTLKPLKDGNNGGKILPAICSACGEREPPKPTKCIAEVTNTPWGDRVTFTFSFGVDEMAKPLHVSPFMDMLSVWVMQTSAPCHSLNLTISSKHPESGTYFTAKLELILVPPRHVETWAGSCSRKCMEKYTDTCTESVLWFLWLMPQLVAVWIYWEAFCLWWKGVPLYTHPKYMIGNGNYQNDVLFRIRNQHEEVMETKSQLLLDPYMGSKCPFQQLNCGGKMMREGNYGKKLLLSGQEHVVLGRTVRWEDQSENPWL